MKRLMYCGVWFGVWLGVLVLSASLGLAQQDFSGVEVSATPVNGSEG